MSLWFGDVSGIDLAAMATGTLIENLGIEIVELREHRGRCSDASSQQLDAGRRRKLHRQRLVEQTQGAVTVRFDRVAQRAHAVEVDDVVVSGDELRLAGVHRDEPVEALPQVAHGDRARRGCAADGKIQIQQLGPGVLRGQV